MRRRSDTLKASLCQAEQRDLKTIAPLSHRPIILTNTIDYRSIVFCTIVLTLNISHILFVIIVVMSAKALCFSAVSSPRLFVCSFVRSDLITTVSPERL